MKQYGPSNWEQRKNETRAQIIKHESAPGKNDAEKALAIWTASDLFREQTTQSLEGGENTPDALWAASDEIQNLHDAIHKKKPEAQEWLNRHLPLIKDGIRRYANVPRNLVVAKGAPRIQGHTANRSASVLKELEDMGENLVSDYYIWEMIRDMLRLVAEYEDAIARTTDESPYNNSDPQEPSPPPITGAATFERKL